MKTALRAISLAVLLLTGAMHIHAQENKPSLQESLDWLKPTLESYGTFSFELSEGRATAYSKASIKILEFSGCTLKWTNQIETAFNDGEKVLVEITNEVPMAAIDVAGLKSSESKDNKGRPLLRIVLHTSYSKPLIKSHMVVTRRATGKVVTTDDAVDETAILLNDNEIATRVVRALRNVATLCGSRPDPF